MWNRRDYLKSIAAFFGSLTSIGGFLKSAQFLQASPLEGEAYWNHLRWQFLIPEEEAYFNTGTLGASPKVVLDATISHLQYVEEALAKWEFGRDMPERLGGYRPEKNLRHKLAGIIGCDLEEVGLTVNATVAMNLVANGLDLQKGDEVLMTDQEHGGGRSGWDVKAKRFGIQVIEVPIGKPPESPQTVLSAFEKAMTPKTKVLAIPHITSGHGTILPIKELCRVANQRGILTVIDGAQAVGMLEVDVRDLDCDAYFASPHKWLLAPKGNGFLYIRKSVQDRFWTTLAGYQWDNYKEGMFRMTQYGTTNQSLLRGLEASIDFVTTIGLDRIEKRIRFLGEHLREGLSQIPGVVLYTSMSPDLSAGITRYGIEGIGGRQLQDELWNRKRIRVRMVGPSAVRQSCHIYNSRKEIETTLEVVRKLAKG